MVMQIHGTYKVTYHLGPGTDKVYEAEFTPPFKRINMYAELGKPLNVELPNPENLASHEANEFLDKLATDHNVDCPAPRTTARLLDKETEEKHLKLNSCFDCNACSPL